MLADAYVAFRASFSEGDFERQDVDDTSSRYLILDDTTLSKTGKCIKDPYTANC